MNKRRLYESIMRDVAKVVKKRLNENFDSDSFLDEIENLIDELREVITINEFEHKAFATGEINSSLKRILQQYDEYMEYVMWVAVDENKDPYSTARKILNKAEDNYRNYGTEMRFVIDFLEDLIRWAKR